MAVKYRNKALIDLQLDILRAYAPYGSFHSKQDIPKILLFTMQTFKNLLLLGSVQTFPCNAELNLAEGKVSQCIEKCWQLLLIYQMMRFLV